MSTMLVMPESIEVTVEECGVPVANDDQLPTYDSSVTQHVDDDQNVGLEEKACSSNLASDWTEPTPSDYQLSCLAELIRAESDIKEAEAKVAELQASLKEAKKSVEYRKTRLREIVCEIAEEQDSPDESPQPPQVQDVTEEAPSEEEPAAPTGKPTKAYVTKAIGGSIAAGETLEVIRVCEHDGAPVVKTKSGDSIFLQSGEYEYCEWEPAASTPPHRLKKLPDDDAWKSVKLSSLQIPAGTIKLLAESKLETVGQLANFTQSKRLTDIPGVGPGKATVIEEALDKFWATRA